jgi:hypothetical protein
MPHHTVMCGGFCKLLLIGLQGKNIPVDTLPPSNLVFSDRCFRLYDRSKQVAVGNCIYENAD